MRRNRYKGLGQLFSYVIYDNGIRASIVKLPTNSLVDVILPYAWQT